jgi:phage/plasmid-associated DNA primase
LSDTPPKKARGYADPTEASFNQVYSFYKKNARRSGREFSLSKDEFRALTQQPCHYCGQSRSRAFKTYKTKDFFVGNGVDRVLNSDGYRAGNVVPCCTECNARKSASTFEEFRAWIARVASHLILKVPTPKRKAKRANRET